MLEVSYSIVQQRESSFLPFGKKATARGLGRRRSLESVYRNDAASGSRSRFRSAWGAIDQQSEAQYCITAADATTEVRRVRHTLAILAVDRSFHRLLTSSGSRRIILTFLIGILPPKQWAAEAAREMLETTLKHSLFQPEVDVHRFLRPLPRRGWPVREPLLGKQAIIVGQQRLQVSAKDPACKIFVG